MKKSWIALILAAVLLAVCPLNALAASAKTPAQSIAALQANLNKPDQERSSLGRLSSNLLRSLTGKLQNAEILPEDAAAALNETAGLLADIYASLGSTTSNLLGAATSADSTAAGHFDLAAAPAQGGTIKTLSKEMSKYLFIKVDNAEDVAALIAETCEFDYVTLSDGRGTIYIRVDIEKNPQIFNYAVFRHLVEDLYAKQGEEMKKHADGSVDYLMSYEHIAGELALHAILYAATSDIIRLTGSNNARLLSLYNSARVANLNVDEARVPTQFISLFGTILMNYVSYAIMSAFGMA